MHIRHVFAFASKRDLMPADCFLQCALLLLKHVLTIQQYKARSRFYNDYILRVMAALAANSFCKLTVANLVRPITDKLGSAGVSRMRSTFFIHGGNLTL